MGWLRKHKILTICLLTFLLLVGAVVGYIWSKLSLIQFDDGSGSQVVQKPEEGSEAADQIVDISGLEISQGEPVVPTDIIEDRDDVVNILLLGTDERTSYLSDAARSDSMILVSINKTDKTVKLVSLERGMGVPVLEGEHEGQYDWLTHIFRYGGADLVCKTVEHCFRVEVDHYVRVNFTTVTTVVDAIGGIDIYLSAAEAGALNQDNLFMNRWDHVNHKEGMNHIDGTSALSLARLRRIDSDWQRTERQRRVILAVVDALKGASIKDLNNLLDQMLPLVQTNMTMLDIADLVLYAPNLLSSTFDQMVIPQEGTYGGMTGMGGRGLFKVDFEVNSQILKDFLYGTGAREVPET